MTNIVVTGATSMIGIALIKEMLKHEVEQIFAVVQNNTQKLARLPDDARIKIIRCSADEYDKLPDLVGCNCDVFYHFAWVPARKLEQGRYFDAEIAHLNIAYSLKAFEAAEKLKAKKFIGAGSQAEYGNERKPLQGPNDATNPVTAYGIAKDTVRRLLEIRAKQVGICFLWVRIFSVYGINDRPDTLISSILKKMIKNEEVALTAGEQIWEYLFEEDAGEALYLIGANAPCSNIYCLGSGDAKKLKFFIEEIKSAVSSNSPLQWGEIAYSASSVMNLCADISKLKKDTNWTGPKIDFKVGILKIFNHLKAAKIDL